MSMCESILTIALVCTVKYLHYCDYYYTLGNDSQSTPKLIAYLLSVSPPLYPASWLYGDDGDALPGRPASFRTFPCCL